MHLLMLGIAEHDEVLSTVVVFDPIDMVDVFVCSELASQHLLGNQSVLQLVLVPPRADLDQDIAVSSQLPVPDWPPMNLPS